MTVLALTVPAGAQGPAVSAANGKIEFDAGVISAPQSFVNRAAGTLTLPLGAQFGLQVDGSAALVNGFTGSAALHVFTRDPDHYLLGGTIGAMRTPTSSIVAAGPEVELYMDIWTLEAWGGVALVRPNSGSDRTGVFAMGDVAIYPEPDLRVSLGLSLLDGFAALHAGAEYQLGGTAVPLALTADARLGQDGSVLATVGLRAYFGDPQKTLIARHREDDPWDRSGGLFTSVGGAAPGGGATPPVTDCPFPLVLVEGKCVDWPV